MARSLAIALLLWAFILGPALCMGGILEHACDGCDEDAYQHEELCTGDSCYQAAQPDDHGDHLDEPTWCEVETPLSWEGPRTANRTSPRQSIPPHPPDRPKLAYALSDGPMRI